MYVKSRDWVPSPWTWSGLPVWPHRMKRGITAAYSLLGSWRGAGARGMMRGRGFPGGKASLPGRRVERLRSPRPRCPPPGARRGWGEPMKPAPPVTRKRDEGAIRVREQRADYGGAGGIKSMNKNARHAPGPGGGREHVGGHLDAFVFAEPVALEAELVQHPLGRLVLPVGHGPHPAPGP